MHARPTCICAAFRSLQLRWRSTQALIYPPSRAAAQQGNSLSPGGQRAAWKVAFGVQPKCASAHCYPAPAAAAAGCGMHLHLPGSQCPMQAGSGAHRFGGRLPGVLLLPGACQCVRLRKALSGLALLGFHLALGGQCKQWPQKASRG